MRTTTETKKKLDGTQTGAIIRRMIGSRRPNRFGCLVSKGEGKPYLARWMFAGKIYTKSTGEVNYSRALRRLEEITAPFRADSAEEILSNLKAQLEKVRNMKTKREVPLADIWDLFAERDPEIGNVTGGTLKNYKRGVTDMITWMRRNGARHLGEITPERATHFLRHEREANCLVSYNCRLVLLKRVWRVLSGEKDIQIVPETWESFQKLKGAKNASERRALKKEEVKALLAESSKDRNLHLLITLGLYTGQRLGDCASLKWENIDMEKGFITLTPEKTKRHGVKVSVPMHPELKKELEGMPRDGEYLSGANAKEYKTRTLEKRVSALFETCGIVTSEVRAGKRVILTGFHSLRHTFVSWAIQSGMNALLVQRIVGHTSENMTERYFHENENALKEGIARLNVA